jgi:SiaC family regulatory phosphoprotein
MQRLYIERTENTPEINFSPDENIFFIKGTSSPEDVRAMYYPVIEWLKIFIDDIIDGEYTNFSSEKALIMQTDLAYFNSSSAKFFYDIFIELKRLSENNVRVIVEWFYDEEDLDQKDAGSDIALMVEMEFSFIPKIRHVR